MSMDVGVDVDMDVDMNVDMDVDSRDVAGADRTACEYPKRFPARGPPAAHQAKQSNQAPQVTHMTLHSSKPAQQLQKCKTFVKIHRRPAICAQRAPSDSCDSRC